MLDWYQARVSWPCREPYLPNSDLTNGFKPLQIGSHDKQSWEKTLDAQLLRNVSNLSTFWPLFLWGCRSTAFGLFKNLYCVPKKSTRMDDVLIDIDLVKGSTFSKTKSKMSITRILFNGILRLFLYPFYFRWWDTRSISWFDSSASWNLSSSFSRWQHQTTKFFAIVLLLIYLFQMSNFALYKMHGFNSTLNNKPVSFCRSFRTVSVALPNNPVRLSFSWSRLTK